MFFNTMVYFVPVTISSYNVKEKMYVCLGCGGGHTAYQVTVLFIVSIIFDFVQILRAKRISKL